MDEYYYRYFDGAMSFYWNQPEPDRFKVLSHTPCGVWIECDSNPSGKKWIHNDSRKKWAWPTIEGAQRSFICRKERQMEILEMQLDYARRCLEEARKHFTIKED